MLMPQYISLVCGVVVDVGLGIFTSKLDAEPVKNWQMEQDAYENVEVAYFC